MSRRGSSRPSCAARAYTEPPDITARVCGICPVAYQVSACNAIEDACGVTVDPELVALRRLLYCGEWIHSHALHIYPAARAGFPGLPGRDQPRQGPPRVHRTRAGPEEGRQPADGADRRAGHPPDQRAVGWLLLGADPHDLEPLAEMLRRALDDALFTVRWVAEFDFPDAEFDHEFLALTDPDRYPIENGTIARSAGPAFAVAEFSDHVVESQVPHSTALHATLDGARYLTGPLARYSPELAPPLPHRPASGRRGRARRAVPKSIPQHRGSCRRGGLRDRGGAAHHRRIRAARAPVRRRRRPAPASATASARRRAGCCTTATRSATTA